MHFALIRAQRAPLPRSHAWTPPMKLVKLGLQFRRNHPVGSGCGLLLCAHRIRTGRWRHIGSWLERCIVSLPSLQCCLLLTINMEGLPRCPRLFGSGVHVVLIPQLQGFQVESFGSGQHVKIPGPTADQPNVYEFGKQTYEDIYQDLVAKDKEKYGTVACIQTTHSASNAVTVQVCCEWHARHG